jgi:TolB-like protein/methylphosphotriester-DNA--protein-cysteine methyltransferase
MPSSRSVATALPAMRSGDPGARGGPAFGSAPVPRDVKKAIDYLRIHVDQEVTMADLLRACGVAERTLRKHFRTFLGFSPLGYLRRMRLAALREELLRATERSTITEIAARYGFHHLGRLSAEYARRFGERPSTTLRLARVARTRGRTQCRASDTCLSHERRRGLSGTAQFSRELPSVVVLPFKTTTAAERLFADSLADGIACALCRARSLTVTVANWSPTVAWMEPQRLARERGARYALRGMVLRAGDRLRALVCLLDVASACQLWGDSYDGSAGDPFPLQDRVVAGIMRAVLPNVRGAEIERARRKPPKDLSAYDLTMRAFPLAFAANPGAGATGA